MSLVAAPLDELFQGVPIDVSIDDIISVFRNEALHSIANPGFDWNRCELQCHRGSMSNTSLLLPLGANPEASALIFVKGEPYDCTVEEACGIALWSALSKLNKARGGLLMALSMVGQHFVERRAKRFFDITDQA